MTEYNRNPLHGLGEFSWADYKVFKAHLRLPRPYPLIIFKNFKHMHDAVIALPSLLAKHSDHMWEKRQMNAEFKEKVYRSYNIPVQYFNPSVYITESPKDQADIDSIITNVAKLKDKGVAVYMHSEFSEGAMNAAMALLRSAADNKVRGYCIAFPSVIDTIKKWDPEDAMLDRMMAVDVLVLWAVGSEYTTEFTNTQLGSILMARKADGKTTVVVSSLSPKDYKTRYGQPPEGAVVGFTDNKMKVTLAGIAKALDKGDQ